MSSLRHSVLEKSLRKSLRNLQDHGSILSDSNISDLDLDLVNKSRDTPGLPSKSCARARSRKRKNTSKKSSMNTDVENAPPVSFVDDNKLDTTSHPNTCDKSVSQKSSSNTCTNEVTFVNENRLHTSKRNDHGTPTSQKSPMNTSVEKGEADVPITVVDENALDNTSQRNDYDKSTSQKSSTNTRVDKSEVSVPVTFVDENKLDVSSKPSEFVPANSQGSSLTKLSREELIDIVMEYQYKYERLRTLVDELKHIVITSKEKQKGLVDDVKNKYQDSLYVLESDKFHLEEKVHKISTENENLLACLQEYENQKISEEKQDTEQNEILHQSIMPHSPRAVSRMKRRSMINQTMTSLALNNESKSKEDLYEDIIIDQQDLLDFYSLLTGVSICKDKPLDEEYDNEDIPTKVCFKCKLQVLTSTYDEVPFNMALSFDQQEINVAAIPDDVDGPTILRNNSTYDADEGYSFIKALLNNI